MSQTDQDDDCVSKKPWGEVLSRSLKLFTFNAASEGGKSFGRVIFFVILGIIVLMLATYIIDSITGWFSGWFDFWPFDSSDPAPQEVTERSGWWPFASDASAEPEPVMPADGDEKWYCRWNPLC